MNGFEFLKIIKGDSVLKKIPVVVLTTSETEQDIMDSYELGAAGYFVKPVDYKHFVEVMKTIQMYWALNKFPNNERLPVSVDTL
jgi:DNA-binding NarL/FixJ family response regulator